MTVGQANKIVKGLIGEDDFHDAEDIIASYYSIAQKQIATTVAPIEKTVVLTGGVPTELPSDLYRIKTVSGGYTRDSRRFITAAGDGQAVLTYYAYPADIPDDAPLSTAFEIDPEAQSALPYFAAAQVVLADSDMRRYNTFMDTYNNILTNISASGGHMLLTVVEL